MATTVPAYDQKTTNESAALGALGGAASGAMAGLTGGPIGAVIGGVIGAVVGGVGAGAADAQSQKAAIKSAKAAASAENREAIDNAANVRAATKGGFKPPASEVDYLRAGSSTPYAGGSTYDTWAAGKGF